MRTTLRAFTTSSLASCAGTPGCSATTPRSSSGIRRLPWILEPKPGRKRPDLLLASRLRPEDNCPVSTPGESRLRGCRHPLAHLLRRHVFDMRGDPPGVAEAVLDTAATVAVELIGRLTHRCSACLESPPVRRITVVDVEMNHRRYLFAPLARVAHHHHRVADACLAMHNAAVRAGHADGLLGPERLLYVVEEVACAADGEIGGDALVTLRGWSDCHCWASFA